MKPPPDVLAQLEADDGWLGEWLPYKYGARQLSEWRNSWLKNTPTGQAVAKRMAQREAGRQMQLQVQREREQQQRAQEQRRLDALKGTPIEKGTRVKVGGSATQSLIGRTGTVLNSICPNSQWLAIVQMDRPPRTGSGSKFPPSLELESIPCRDLVLLENTWRVSAPDDEHSEEEEPAASVEESEAAAWADEVASGDLD